MDELARRRVGTTAGVAAYTLWGIFPLAFHHLASVNAGEVLLHRIIWSFVVAATILVWRGDRRWFDQVRGAARVGSPASAWAGC